MSILPELSLLVRGGEPGERRKQVLQSAEQSNIQPSSSNFSTYAKLIAHEKRTHDHQTCIVTLTLHVAAKGAKDLYHSIWKGNSLAIRLPVTEIKLLT